MDLAYDSLDNEIEIMNDFNENQPFEKKKMIALWPTQSKIRLHATEFN